jgi:hypothetical protein
MVTFFLVGVCGYAATAAILCWVTGPVTRRTR